MWGPAWGWIGGLTGWIDGVAEGEEGLEADHGNYAATGLGWFDEDEKL